MTKFDLMNIHPPASGERTVVFSPPDLPKTEHLKMLRSFFRRHACEGAERPPRRRPVVWTLESLVQAALSSKCFVDCTAKDVKQALATAGLLRRFEDVEGCCSVCEHDRLRYRRFREDARRKRHTRYFVSAIVVVFEHRKHFALTANPDDEPRVLRLLASPRAFVLVSAACSNGCIYLLLHKAGATTPAGAIIDLIEKLKVLKRRDNRPARMLVMIKNLPRTCAEALRNSEVFDANVPVFSYCDHPRYRALEKLLKEELKQEVNAEPITGDLESSNDSD